MLEDKNKKAILDDITNKVKLEDDSDVAAELEYRKALLAEYNKAHPDKPLTDELIQNEVPRRLTKELEEGKITTTNHECVRV